MLALDDAGDAVLLLVGDAEGVPVEFVVAALDGFLGVLHIVAQEAHSLVVAGAKLGDMGGRLLYGAGHAMVFIVLTTYIDGVDDTTCKGEREGTGENNSLTALLLTLSVALVLSPYAS